MTGVCRLSLYLACCQMLLLPCCTLGSENSANELYELTVDVDDTLAPLKRFWRSTGFCPPSPHENFRDYVLTEDELQNIALIGSVARQGIKQVRIHWLLDLVKVTGHSPSALKYDFTDLDTLIDWLHRSQLQPGFEIMGNPSSYFTTFDDKAQVMLWKDLVEQVATRYVTRFGLDEVAEWNFETWNEPSNGDFDTLKVSVQGFLNYYDACSEGLKAVSPRLRLGGPGDGCHTTSTYCWPFLEHCANGTNFFTGEKGVRVDFISFHHKGHGTAEVILDSSNITINTIRSQYPQLAHVDIYNDEADPLVGWNHKEEWRADVRYAAMVVKVIAQHQNFFLSTPARASHSRYALLSNDNGFMNWDPLSHFDERTLTTRFRMNLTQPRSVEMVKKPVLSVMSLLAMLGETQLAASFKPQDPKGRIGALATSHTPNASDPGDSWEVVVLIFNSDDTNNGVGLTEIQLTIDNAVPPNATANPPVMQFFVMNNDQSNPDSIWKEASQPQYPSKALLAKMRSSQEPVSRVYDKYTQSSGPGGRRIDMNFRVYMPGIALVHLCQPPALAPPQVSGLWLHNVSSTSVLVVWRSVDVRCLLTYRVLYSTAGLAGKFRPANEGIMLISTSFIHALSQEDVANMAANGNLTLTYQISAVDYVYREGARSTPVTVVLS